MSIRKIGGVYFWTIGALGGSVYVRASRRREFILDIATATIVGVGIGILVGFGI